MKVFVADNVEKGEVTSTDYHWCDNEDLLMFGVFQLGNGNPSEVSMCGVKSRKFTTHIIVKDLDIDEDFYRELLTNSIEKGMDCEVDENGEFEVDIAFGFKFSVHDIISELLNKANEFDDEQKVSCFGRTLTKV